MTAIELLSYLRSLDVKLWADGDRLHYSAPKGALTAALRTELAAHKAEILTFLHKEQRARRATLPPLLPVSRSADLPLSFAQQRLWFLDQLMPGTAVYNLPAAMRLRGALNRAALEASLDEIVRRHEVLRTCFVAVEGKPVQMIAPSAKLAVTVIDLSPMPDAERAEGMQRLASEEARRPFNLAQGPLVRATLLRLSDQEHVLLLTLHHIVSDAWSRGVFNHELTALYEAFAAGRPSPLAALPVQYADYVVWQRECLQGAVLERQLQYWRQRLAGVPVLELPCDHPRPAVETYRGARAAFRLPKQLSMQLTALSRRESVTLYMTLLAAFQTLLARYTGQDDIALGSPIAGRNRAEFEGLIGFFVNTLVMRSDLSGDPTFREVLGRVREVALGAYAHQELPFEQLVEELAPVRSLSHSPLLQVMFVLQNAPKQTLELSAISLEPLEVDSATSKFDLTLFMDEGTDGLSGQLEYNTDLFEAGTIRRMLGHWEVLLDGIAADPGRRLSELPLLPEAERRQLLVDWNRTEADYPRACLHELFERQAARTPGAVALIDEGERLTYAEVNARANQLARYLQRLGVGPEVPVGICVERSLEVVVGLLGILKAGGAYVPLDPAYPAPHLAFMLEDAAVQYVLTQERLRASLPWRGAEVVCLDADRTRFAQESDHNVGIPMTPEHAAYVMYTSGSTGTPKGVVGPHRGTLNRCQWMWEHYPFAPHEVCCQKTALSFVDSVWEIFGPLLQGIPLLLVREHVVKDPAQLVQHLAVHHVSRITLVPSLLRAILDVLAQAPETLPALKFWVSSGEPLLPDLAQRFLDLLPHAFLINLYGSSEVAADVTWYEVGQRDSRASSVPIGRPIANTQIYVLDQQLNPVPVGVSGEIYVGGANVAQGYLNRPDLTAAKFIPDPFGSQPGGRLYRTGDLARYRPDGTLEYLGRIDHQVKVRGYRIELGEVEAVLREQAGVREAVVVAGEAMPGDQRLVAYVAPAREPAPTASELRTFLKARLPEYMIPSAFVFLEALPLTPNGKVDRNALPQPKGGRPELERGFVAPHDAFERQLTHMWEDLLGVRPIGVHDDFFELGGHSLLAVQLFAHIEMRLGIRLPLATLFEHPTIAHLAHGLRHHGEAAPGALPLKVPHEQTVSDRIRHPIARYLPSQYHPAMRRTYRRLKRSSLGRALQALYIRQGKKIAKRFFSYTPMQLEHTLRTMGITSGDTVLMHSAFRVFNGFAGTPEQVIACVLKVIGESGTLVMVSLPYTGSTAAYLRAGVPFDVRQTRSAMGVITEVFRHTPGVVRSVNPAHPVLAWGPAAPWLIAGHEHTRYSCGKGSPFEKLVQLQAKALLFDVSLRTLTFFHYVQDLLQDTSPVNLYEDMPVESLVIDANGNTKMVKTYVFSSASRRHRSHNLRQALLQNKLIARQKIGNTQLIVLHLQDVVDCAQHMVKSGKSLWKVGCVANFER